jgi:hypothetical protein
VAVTEDVADSTEELDELYATLAGELEGLISLADRVAAELDAIDERRIAMTGNGGRVLSARRMRRSAIVTRTQAVEFCQRAHETRERAQGVIAELESAMTRARSLLDLSDSGRGRRPPPDLGG